MAEALPFSVTRLDVPRGLKDWDAQLQKGNDLYWSPAISLKAGKDAQSNHCVLQVQFLLAHLLMKLWPRLATETGPSHPLMASPPAPAAVLTPQNPPPPPPPPPHPPPP